MTSSRRDVLEFAIATATVATVGAAGSNTVTAQEDVDGPPTYSEWLALEDDGLEFVAVDWATLEGYVTDELEEASPDEAVPAEYEADPMIAPVSEGLLSAYFSVGLGLGQYRLGGLLDEAAFESTVEELILTHEAVVLTGTIQPAEIDAQITAEAGLEFVRGMELTDEIGEYDVYTPVEGDDAAIGIGDDALVVVDDDAVVADGDPVTVLETTIGVSEGDVARATDESEAVAWVLEAAGDGDVAVGQYGDRVGADDGLVDLTFEGLEDAEGIVSSLSVVDEETSTGDFAAILDDPDEDELEEFLGASADERSIDVEDDRVTATGTWREVEATIEN